MRVAEAQDRVSEFDDLISRHLHLMDQLKNGGEDLTSADIILHSLRISLLVAAQAWPQGRLDDERHPKDALSAPATLEPSSHLTLVTHGTFVHEGIPAGKAKHKLVNLAIKPDIQEVFESLSVAMESHKEKNSSIRDFDFRSLTQEEKREFTSKLELKSKRLLAALADTVVYIGGSAACEQTFKARFHEDHAFQLSDSETKTKDIGVA